MLDDFGGGTNERGFPAAIKQRLAGMNQELATLLPIQQPISPAINS